MLFFAIAFIPAFCYAQGGPGGGGATLCWEEERLTCAQMGIAFGGSCLSKTCFWDPTLLKWKCPGNLGLIVTQPLAEYWSVKEATPGRSIVNGPVPGITCGQIWTCTCEGSGTCVSDVFVGPFNPNEWTDN